MVGKSILTAATACFALASALALPKDKVDDKTKHGHDDDKARLPHKPGRLDKDCSTSAPYPTGDPTDAGFATGFATGTVFGTGTIGILPSGTGLARRYAQPDKGKDDASKSSSSTITANVASPTGVEDNLRRGGDDSRSSPITGSDDTTTLTITTIATETITPSQTITITIETALAPPTTISTPSSTKTKGQKGKKAKSSTRSIDDSASATPI